MGETMPHEIYSEVTMKVNLWYKENCTYIINSSQHSTQSTKTLKPENTVKVQSCIGVLQFICCRNIRVQIDTYMVICNIGIIGKLIKYFFEQLLLSSKTCCLPCNNIGLSESIRCIIFPHVLFFCPLIIFGSTSLNLYIGRMTFLFHTNFQENSILFYYLMQRRTPFHLQIDCVYMLILKKRRIKYGKGKTATKHDSLTIKN